MSSGNVRPERDSGKLEELMRLSQQGDREAFAALCELRRERLSAEVRRKIDPRLLARVDPSDVIQEVFIDANRRLGEVLANEISLIAWLRFLCNQKLVDLQRAHIGAQKRSVRREEPQQPFDDFTLDSIAEHLVSNLTSPSMQVHRRDLAGKIRMLLSELSPLDREVLVLRHFHDMTNQEVADSVGLSTNAASNRYVRALRRFKKILDVSEINVSGEQD